MGLRLAMAREGMAWERKRRTRVDREKSSFNNCPGAQEHRCRSRVSKASGFNELELRRRA
jgi:hypothetical protein